MIMKKTMPITVLHQLGRLKPVCKPRNKNWLQTGQQAQWIWTKWSQANQKLWFRKEFTLPSKVTDARLYATCDNHAKLSINGKAVGVARDWQYPIELDVEKFLVTGNNVVSAECRNAGGVAAFVLKLQMELQDGSEQTVVTGTDWKLSLYSQFSQHIAEPLFIHKLPLSPANDLLLGPGLPPPLSDPPDCRARQGPLSRRHSLLVPPEAVKARAG